MKHPEAIRPEDHAEFREDKMGKATLFESSRILVGLNSFEVGQEHALHAHSGMDKVYQVLTGEGLFLLEDREVERTHPWASKQLQMKRLSGHCVCTTSTWDSSLRRTLSSVCVCCY